MSYAVVVCERFNDFIFALKLVVPVIIIIVVVAAVVAAVVVTAVVVGVAKKYRHLHKIS